MTKKEDVIEAEPMEPGVDLENMPIPEENPFALVGDVYEYQFAAQELQRLSMSETALRIRVGYYRGLMNTWKQQCANLQMEIAELKAKYEPEPEEDEDAGEDVPDNEVEDAPEPEVVAPPKAASKKAPKKAVDATETVALVPDGVDEPNGIQAV